MGSGDILKRSKRYEITESTLANLRGGKSNEIRYSAKGLHVFRMWRSCTIAAITSSGNVVNFVFDQNGVLDRVLYAGIIRV